MEERSADKVAVETPVNVDETGSIATATEALLTMLDAEDAPPATETEPTPDGEEEAQLEETEDADSDDAEEEEAVEESDEDDEYEPEDNRDEEGDDVEDVYTVKVDGADTDVTLDELLAGYSRHSDYTKKTQQLSEERKHIEEMAQAFSQELHNTQAVREQYVNQMGQYIQNGLHGLQRWAGVDWARMKEEDPIEYVTKRDEFREEQSRIGAMQKQQEHAAKLQQHEAAKLHRAQLAEEGERLADTVPEWADEKKRPEIAGQIREYAQSVGFSAEEVDAVIDHRAINVLLKAARYDALQGAGKSKKVKRNPKLVKAGAKKDKTSSNSKKRKAQLNRLSETGSYKDAAKLMEDLI